MTSKLGRIVADFTTSLATSVSAGATSATLQSAVDDDGVALASGHYLFTLDGDNSQKEHISCDLSGTALTNIKSISRQGVITTGLVRAHRAGASCKGTDFAHLIFINDLLRGATDLDASDPLKYDGTATINDSNHLATKAYVDGVAIAGGADASTTVKGLNKMSVAPADAASPIAVGDNDPRVPSTGENDALAGGGSLGTPSSSNKFVTETGMVVYTPPGIVLPYAAASAPTGYLLCDGTAVSRTTYAALFAIVGTTYGSGNGSTTFNVPNIKGKVIVGLDASQTEFDALAEAGGAKTHTLTTAEIPSHSHSGAQWAGGSGGSAIHAPSNGNTSGSSSTDSAGGGGAHNNLQPYVVMNYIIKT